MPGAQLSMATTSAVMTEASRRAAGRPKEAPQALPSTSFHELTVANRSLSDRAAREKLFQLPSTLADVVDPTSGADVQEATIRIEINAAAGDLDQLGSKAREADATWDAHSEDY
jgi:hypothetical protein